MLIGLYTKDPKKYSDAEMISKITFKEVLEKDLKAVDTAGITLCREWNKDVLLFGLNERGSMYKAAMGEKIGEGYNTKKSNELIAKNVVTIFTCGTGNPFFSTDTAAIMRAIEIKADIILLAKNVDRTLYKRS